jgi:hypothetical protein
MDSFQTEIADGSQYVGSPETVATKLAATIRMLGLSRVDLAYAVGRVPNEQRMATIKLYGREVIPRVRELLAAGIDDGNATSHVLRCRGGGTGFCPPTLVSASTGPPPTTMTGKPYSMSGRRAHRMPHAQAWTHTLDQSHRLFSAN